MDNLECLGTETDLGECQHGGFAQHNCGHEEDVSISCNSGKNLCFTKIENIINLG